MDQRRAGEEEEEERNSQDSTTDHHQSDGGYEEAEEETAPGVLKLKEVEVEVVVVGGRSVEEASAPSLLAHPCSLLQFLLRACAGCLGLHGYCIGDDDAAAPAVADSPQEGERQGGGDKTAATSWYLHMQEVWAVRRRPLPPGRPREGSGGNGGNHN